MITTPDGQEMAIGMDGSLTPVQVIVTPEGKEMAKLPSGKVSPMVRTPVMMSPVNGQSANVMQVAQGGIPMMMPMMP